MKKTIALIATAFSMYNTAGAQTFTLDGKFTGSNTPYVYLVYTNMDGVRVSDSAVVNNGTFSFKGRIDAPVIAYFHGRMASRGMDDPNSTSIFIEPGKMTMKVSENAFKELVLTGSVTQADKDMLDKAKEPVTKEWAPFFHKLDSVREISNFKWQEMKAGLKPYYAAMEKIDFSYIHAHRSSWLTAYLLRSYSHSVPDDTLSAYYDGFPAKLQQSVFGKFIREEMERRKIGVPGTMAAGFSKTDINGKPLQLSDFKGKYVLLDFWASWCLPCRKGNPHLRQLYKKYRNKGFEIIGVSDDDSKPDAWKKAVSKDSIGIWKHVLRGIDMEKIKQGLKGENDLSAKYGIYSLPTKILIDPDGKIIGRYSGDGEEDADLDKKLEEVFGS